MRSIRFQVTDWDIVMPATAEDAGAIPRGIHKGAEKCPRFKRYLKKNPGLGVRKDHLVRVSVKYWC